MKAAAARRDITPPVGTVLMGYGPRASTSVHDSLNVTALALEQSGCRTVILSVTTTIIDDEETLRIRESVGKALKMPYENVTVCAWQIHSGPATQTCYGWDDRNDEYCQGILEPSCVEAALEAFSGLGEALTGVEEIESHVGINRRQLLESGEVALGQNPFGPYDKTMTAVRLISASDKKPIANIIHYGAHPTATGPSGEITRDWPGVMVDCVEQEIGGMTLFVNGAVGDVGPRLANGRTTGDIGQMMVIGNIAAADATAACRKVKSFADRPLKLIVGDISIKYRPLAKADHAQEALKNSEGRKDSAGLGKAEFIYWGRVLEEHKSGDIKTEKVRRQTITHIGDIVLVPFACEPFADIVLRLREYSKYRYTLCASTTNGSDGYLPTREALHRGGYEVEVAKAFSPYIPVENIDDLIIRENLRLLS